MEKGNPARALPIRLPIPGGSPGADVTGVTAGNRGNAGCVAATALANRDTAGSGRQPPLREMAADEVARPAVHMAGV